MSELTRDRAFRQLFASVEGMKTSGKGWRERLNEALESGEATTEQGRLLLKVADAVRGGDVPLATTLLNEMPDAALLDQSRGGSIRDRVQRWVNSRRLAELRQEREIIMIEELKIQGHYGPCSNCGKEGRYAFAPGNLCGKCHTEEEHTSCRKENEFLIGLKIADIALSYYGLRAAVSDIVLEDGTRINVDRTPGVCELRIHKKE